MKNNISLEIKDVDDTIKETLSTLSPGQRVTITVEAMVVDSNDKTLDATVEDILDVTADLPENESETETEGDNSEDMMGSGGMMGDMEGMDMGDGEAALAVLAKPAKKK